MTAHISHPDRARRTDGSELVLSLPFLITQVCSLQDGAAYRGGSSLLS